MPGVDIFKNDAFSMTSLTTAINEQPHQPGRLGTLKYFTEVPVSTTVVEIEKQKGLLKLVQTSPRGSPKQPVGNSRRELRTFKAPHLQEDDAILADRVQNVRAFGSQTELQTVQDIVNMQLGNMRRNIDVTLEYHRIGAIRGQILDADGTSVIYDLYDEFGYTQTPISMALGTDATKVRTKILGAKRKSEDALGAAIMSGFRVFCSDSFFDAFIDHPNVQKAYEIFQANEMLRNDPRGGFKFGDVIWENYRGKVGATAFIPDGDAFLVPEGVVDLFITYFAPADYNETVNTLGLPYYAKQEVMQMDKGIDIQAQSNPLCMCTRPNAIQRLTVA